MIYLDNAATTRVLYTAFNAAVGAMGEFYGNPSSLHDIGKMARKQVSNARKKIADFIGADEAEIVFTSGGTEADNLALRGIVPRLKETGRTTIITTRIEHPAVYNTCKEFEKDDDLRVLYVPVDQDGRVDIEELEFLIQCHKDSIGLVSIMAVNNEVGAIQLIDDIGDLCQEYGAFFMTDAVQALGHIPLDVNKSHIDLMAMSGHKIGAMKGIGALYVRRGIELSPIVTGGGQEFDIRSGTENVPGIVSMGQAVDSYKNVINILPTYYAALREYFLCELDQLGVEYSVNCDCGVPNIISLTLPGCEGSAMVLLLNDKGICVSAGSACSAGSLEPSRVLMEMYQCEEDAVSTIRISMGGDTTETDMIFTAHAIKDCVDQLHTFTKKEEKK